MGSKSRDQPGFAMAWQRIFGVNNNDLLIVVHYSAIVLHLNQQAPVGSVLGVVGYVPQGQQVFEVILVKLVNVILYQYVVGFSDILVHGFRLQR